MRYTWDETKARTNFAKHWLHFADAERVFDGPCVTFVDDRFDYGEERMVTLGLKGHLKSGQSGSPKIRPVKSIDQGYLALQTEALRLIPSLSLLPYNS